MALDSSADLLFRVGADPSDAIANIGRFRSLMAKDLSAMRADFSGWAKNVFGDLSTLEGKMTAGIAGALAITAALAAGAAVLSKHLYDAAAAAAKYAGEIDDAQDRTGMAAEDLSRLRYVAEMTGLGFDSLSQGLFRLGIATQQAQDGTSAQARAFHDLRITQDQIKAGQKDLLPLFYQVADGFERTASTAQRATMAKDLFRDRSGKLIEVLSMGSQHLKEFSSEADKLGVTLSELDLRSGKQFVMSLEQMNQALRGLKLTIGTEVLPVLNEFFLRIEAYARSAPRIAELYGKMEWWKGIIPGGREIAAVRQGLAIFETELEAGRKRMAARMAALFAPAGKGELAPELVSPKTQKEFAEAAALLSQIQSRLADMAGAESKAGFEAAELRTKISSVAAALQKLHEAGEVTEDTYRSQLAAVAAALPALRTLLEAQLRGFATARQKAEDQTAADLLNAIDQQGEDTYQSRLRAWDKDIALRRAKYIEIQGLDKANEAKLAELEAAGRNRIERDQDEAFIRTLVDLQRDLENRVTAHFTANEHLAWQYHKDLKLFSEVEEAKALLTAEGEAKQDTIRQQFAINRQAALQLFLTDTAALARSQGLQGLFTNVFSDAIRGNEKMLRDFTYGVPGKVNMVSLAFEAMRESADRAFFSMARGMGQNIVQAIVYQKSIGEAIRAATAAALEGLGAECLAYAIYSAALGFLRLAEFLPGSAAQAFQAAALFGAGGIAASLIGRAIAPPQSSGAGSQPASPSGSYASASAESAAGPARPYIQINIAGHIVGRAGIEELTEIINEAVKDRDVRLIATQVKQPQVLNV